MKKLLPLVLLLAILAGCKSDSKSTGPTGDVRSYAREGWISFEHAEYGAAFASFSAALAVDPGYADAWGGLGWSQARLFHAPDAINAFRQALTIAPNSNDACAGMSFAYYGNQDYRLADSTATVLINRATVWVFQHDEGITLSDLRALRASSRYLQGNYTGALTAVQELEPEFTVDVTTASGRALLAQKIEEWMSR